MQDAPSRAARPLASGPTSKAHVAPEARGFKAGGAGASHGTRDLSNIGRRRMGGVGSTHREDIYEADFVDEGRSGSAQAIRHDLAAAVIFRATRRGKPYA